MIRVYFAEREPLDFEANDIELTAAGGLLLRRVEFREEHNPQDIRQKRMVVSNPQLVRAFSRDARWTEVVNLDLEEPAAVRTLEAMR